MGHMYYTVMHGLPQNDYEMLDYFNELREGILEAYSGIVQGLKGEDAANNQLEQLRPYLQIIIQLIIAVSEDRDKTDSLTCCACGLIGSVVYNFSSFLMLNCKNIPFLDVRLF